MRDDVVQLAGDPGPLGLDGAGGPGLLVTLQPVRAVLLAEARCWCSYTIRPITKVRTKSSNAGNTLPMPWPPSSLLIPPALKMPAETAAPVHSGRPSVG